jgi:N-acetylglucosamine kinase-like BadF-type ATPase
MFFLGVDGGGTKTKFALFNDQLKVCGTFDTTTSHVTQVGKEGVIKVLQSGLENVLQEAKICKEEIKYVVLGMPGYTEIKSNDAQIEEAVASVFNFTNYYIVNQS